MKRKTIWLVMSCLTVVAQLLASCALAVTEEESAPSPTAEQQIVTEETEQEKETSR